MDAEALICLEKIRQALIIIADLTEVKAVSEEYRRCANESLMRHIRDIDLIIGKQINECRNYLERREI